MGVAARYTFTYAPPAGFSTDDCPPGTLLQVPMARRTLRGVVVHAHDEAAWAEHRIREAYHRLSEQPLLDEAQMGLARFVTAYYYLAPGQVMSWMLPPKLRTPDKKTDVPPEFWQEPSPPAPLDGSPLKAGQPLDLTEEQRSTLQALLPLKGFHVALLQGVASSGKTEVYLRLMEQVLAEGRQVLYLVPEINLTPQAEKRIMERFAVPSACLHSRITPVQRGKIWAQSRSGHIRVLIGTRSAIFTPFNRLGLIVIDEEHDRSFRQDRGAPYSARDIALWRGQQQGVRVILGSATPSLETLQRARSGDCLHLQMRRRVGNHLPPRIELVDRRGTPAEDLFSAPSVAAIGEQLQAGRQALLFLNQRGYARMLLCPQCGWRVGCHRCDTTKTLHLKRGCMLCHHCGAKSSVPVKCEDCGQPLAPTGAGTEKLMQWCQRTFPGTNVLRIDSDTTRAKGALEELMERAHNETPVLLVGTQMLAKGHHLPHLGLVAVADISIGLMYPDFRSAELMVQTLIQVAGRAGRETGAGRVLMETTLPSHPLLRRLADGDYGAVAEALMTRRRDGEMPPFAHLAVISAESEQSGDALEMLQQLKEVAGAPADVTLIGPLPRAIERLNNRWRAVLQLKSGDRNALRQVLRRIEPEAVRLTHAKPSVQCRVVVDPLETI